MPICVSRLLLPIVMVLFHPSSYTAHPGCNETYSSTSQLQGHFSSTNWPEPYPDSSRCIYKFVGLSTQRVKIKFNSFSLQGMSPECQYDYIDIYIELSSVTDQLLDAPMLGRFCGDNMADDLPRTIISTHNVIILALYTDDNKAAKGFDGTFEFIDASIYNIGAPMTPDGCSYSLSSRERHSGFIVSPTYPGAYPDNLNCKYELYGRPGERIKLVFDDFSLFHGGDYCPFDFLYIKDGRPNSNADDIGTFCGKFPDSTVVYSSREYMSMEFVTRRGRVSFDPDKLHNNADFKFDRKGFNISYEFSNRFTRLNLKNMPQAVHVIGTECDVRITSQGDGSRGVFESPGFPHSFPRNTRCRFFFDGQMNSRLLEKVQIQFRDFFISGNIENCTSGFLGFSYSGHKRPDDIDEKYCGELYPSTRESVDPRMILIFDTHGASEARFVGDYAFLPDYGIPGKPIDHCDCCFQYTSKLQYGSVGTTNTPRHPNNYTSGKECQYIFQPDFSTHEQLLISFETFDVNASEDTSKTRNCVHARCQYDADYLELHERDMTDSSTYRFKPVQRFCGTRFPAPILSKSDIKLVFKSRDRSSYAGFKARYEFLPKNAMRRGCGKIIQSDGKGGEITSPKFPSNYESRTFCEWKIYAQKPQNKILITLETLKMEGRNCSCKNAVLRIQFGDSFREICDSLGDDVKKEAIMSETGEETIQFLTSTHAAGQKGFRLTWTEVHLSDSCYGFKCKNSGYCISSELKCNDLPNCGANDMSDEECPKEEKAQLIHIFIGTSISVFFCLVLIFCGVYHRNKFRTNNHTMSDTDHVEVRYVAATSGSNTTDRLLTMDISDTSRSPERTDPEPDQNNQHQKPPEELNSINATVDLDNNKSEPGGGHVNNAKQNHNNTQEANPAPQAPPQPPQPPAPGPPPPGPPPPPPQNSRPIPAPKIQKVSIV